MPPRDSIASRLVSDTRFAGQEDQLLAPFARQTPRFFERSEFGVAPDQGDRRCGERYRDGGAGRGPGETEDSGGADVAGELLPPTAVQPRIQLARYA